MNTRESFGGTLKVREAVLNLLRLIPDGSSYLVAEWKDEDHPPEWIVSGSAFCWNKERFIEELLATADQWDGDATAMERIEARRDQLAYRNAFKRGLFHGISGASDRMKDSVDTLGESAVAFFFSPPDWPEVTEFWMNRPHPSSWMRGLAAALQETKEGSVK
jgi:hypothetical protein